MIHENILIFNISLKLMQTTGFANRSIVLQHS